MGETGHGIFPAESPVKQVVKREGRQPLLASDHFGDFHQVVVHNVCKVVGRKLVGSFPKHLVVEGGAVDLDVSSDEVIHLHYAVYRHLEAYGPVIPGLQQSPDFLFRKAEGVLQGSPGGVVVDEGLACGLSLGAGLLQLLGCVEGIVGVARSHQLLGILAVYVPALALPVRSVRVLFGRGLHHLSVFVHALVRNDAAPLQGLDDIFLRSRDEAVGVGVFDAYDEVSTSLLCEEVVVKCRPDSSHMQRSGR